MNAIIINILTRTCNRPNYFDINYRSIKNQTTNININININHLVCIDDEITKSYTDNYDDIIVIKVDKLEKSKDYSFPFNLYFNSMHKHDVINNGYIIYLDDDDSFMNNDVINIIEKYLDEDTLIIWQVLFPDGK